MITSCRFVWTAAAVGLVATLAGCGGSDPSATAAKTPSPSSESRTILEVRCDPSRTVTDSTTAVVDRDGLHVKVTDSSGLNGTYLNYLYSAGNRLAPGGGGPVSAGTTDRVLRVPPGVVYLECSYDLARRKTAPVKVQVSDPHGYYRPVTLAALGCSSTKAVSWAIGPVRGKTVEAALDGLIVASKQRSGLHARLAPIGYVGSASRTYILERSGTSWATAVVIPEGGGYVAMLDALC